MTRAKKNTTTRRPGIDEYYLAIAIIAASRGTCARRKVGCVLVDDSKRVVSIGYNGVAPGETHCSVFPCEGAMFKTGKGLDSCRAAHAEQSALIACADIRRVATCYTTVSPCFGCVKLLLQTSCKRAVFLQDYGDTRARSAWLSAGRDWDLVNAGDLHQQLLDSVDLSRAFPISKT